MLIHKEARFECEYCSKRFTKAAYYNEHLRIHRGEQPFECHICQKKFNKKSNLNVHLRFHEKHRDEEGNVRLHSLISFLCILGFELYNSIYFLFYF